MSASQNAAPGTQVNANFDYYNSGDPNTIVRPTCQVSTTGNISIGDITYHCSPATLQAP